MTLEALVDDEAIERVVAAFAAPLSAAPLSAAPLSAAPLSAGGADASVSVDVATIRAWLDLVISWNRRIDLTAARSTAELVDLMLADALAVAPRIPHGARVIDVGTGAGAPGLAIAIARRDLRVTLTEPLAKRASFLRTVIGAIGRTDVELVRGRGESLIHRPSKWDVAVSRATFAPSRWLALGERLVGEGGSVWVFLAREEPPESGRARVAEDFAYILPLTGAPRRAVRYVFRGETGLGA
jgi:16S rRNA (guanine527-N7)-methyltransferase